MKSESGGSVPMELAEPNEITHLLRAIRQKESGAESRLAEAVYPILRDLAGRQMRRERADHTLQPTALVNDAYMRLAGNLNRNWQDRSHFFAVAAQVMRRILIDHARAARAHKRGAGGPKIQLDFDLPMPESRLEDLLIVEEAMQQLERLDPRQCRIVELRFFMGLTSEEVAEALHLSLRQVNLDWRMARAWLKMNLAVAV